MKRNESYFFPVNIFHQTRQWLQLASAHSISIINQSEIISQLLTLITYMGFKSIKQRMTTESEYFVFITMSTYTTHSNKSMPNLDIFHETVMSYIESSVL